MKCQIILSLLFSFSFIFGIQAQNELPSRQPDAAAIQNQRDGEVVAFQNLLRRFETAVKEHDQESVVVLQKSLVDAMSKRVALLEAEKDLDTRSKTQLFQQKGILKDVKDYTFDLQKNKQATIQHLRKLQEFAVLMDDNFEQQ